jgi:excisionase family DNA binding protein
MNVKELIASGANVTITLTPTDLQEFGMALISEAVEQRNKLNVPETYLTVSEAAKTLGITASTLWRWGKDGYLKPVKIGSKSRYKLSDIKKIKEG